MEHFNCESCGRSLIGTNFVRKDDKPYCKICPTNTQVKAKKVEDILRDICAQCKQGIEHIALEYRGQKWHPHHFSCFKCQKTLDHQAREIGEELFCYADYEKAMSNVCFSCRMPIMGVPVSANGKVFHPEHFVCYKCNTPMHRSKYYPFENRVYCEPHFKEVTGKVCQYCLRVAKGKCKMN